MRAFRDTILCVEVAGGPAIKIRRKSMFCRMDEADTPLIACDELAALCEPKCPKGMQVLLHLHRRATLELITKRSSVTSLDVTWPLAAL